MKQRVNYLKKGQNAMKAMYALGGYMKNSSLEQSLLDLIYFRVSQINGCAFCLDMHSKDLRANGETEQRLFVLDAWREAPFYTKKERAALAFAEALTTLKGGELADEIYNETAMHFTESELIDLTFGVITINSYNRINIAFGASVGTYQTGQYD